MQLEALWVLTNFAEASSKHTKVVLEVGVIPRIVSILKYNSEVEILEQVKVFQFLYSSCMKHFSYSILVSHVLNRRYTL